MCMFVLIVNCALKIYNWCQSKIKFVIFKILFCDGRLYVDYIFEAIQALLSWIFTEKESVFSWDLVSAVTSAP